MKKLAVQIFFILLLTLPLAAGEGDALAISANIRARHIPYGAILDPVFAAPDSDEIVNYSRCGDSAIWTAHWLAAESYRYAVTRSPESLENVRIALIGLSVLMDVSGTNLMARCAVPIDSPYANSILSEEREHGAYSGFADNRQQIWIGNTSRDQYAGLFYGLTVAWDVVPDQGVRDMVSYLTTRALDFLRGNNWFVRMPDGSVSTLFLGRADQQLSFLKLGRRLNPNRFEAAYRTQSPLLAPEVIAPIAIEVLDQHNSYFKFNLDTITFYGLLVSGDSSWLRLFYSKAYDVLRNTTDNHGNAFFNMMDRAINGPNPRRDEETRQMLEQWLQRPRRDDFVDLRGKYEACGEDRACAPIPVPERVRTDFLWQRSPYLLYGGGQGTIEGSGIDYILPYWMARFYGVL